MALKRTRISASDSAGSTARAMPIGDGQKALEELLRIGPAADGEEIDELDEEPRAAARWRAAPSRPGGASPGRKRSCPMRSSGPLGTSRMPVASTTIGAGHAAAKRSYQLDDLLGDVAFFGRPPRHHGGTQVRWASATGPISIGENSRDAAASAADGTRAGRGRKPDPLRWSPHGSTPPFPGPITAFIAYSAGRRVFRRAGGRRRLPIAPEAYS